MISQCPSCTKQIDVPEAALGKKVRCSGCQAVFVVEATAPPAPPPKKKATEAPKAPPPAEEKLDNLEVLDDEPAPPKVKPAPVKKKPAAAVKAADDNPFSFEGPSPLAGGAIGADPASSLDFSAEQPKLNVGIRMRIAGAGRMMMIGTFMSFVLSLLMALQAILSGGNPMYLLGGLSAALVVYTGSVVILLCAHPLLVLRSRGLGIAAAILCLLISLPGLCGVIAAVILLIAGLGAGLGGGSVGSIAVVVAVILGFVSLVQCINCLWGGIGTLLFIFRADVGEAIDDSLKREAGVAAMSTNLVGGACTRAAIWQLMTAILVVVNLAALATALVLLWLKPEPMNPTVLISIGVFAAFFLIILVMNLGGVAALFLKRFFVLANVGGVACLVAALFSFCGGVIGLPSILVIPDPLIRGIMIAYVIVMVLLNIFGLVGFITAMDAARLLRKYGGAPVIETPAA